MKFLAVIFSVYFLSLGLIPCEDEAIDQDTTEFHQVDQAHASGIAADDCSPFCQCHCCHVHITQFEGEEIKLITPEISNKIAQFRYEIGDGISPSFFQPPRV